jgi:hypothetical protein
MSTTYTHQQIAAAVREAEQRILPAKLVDPTKDGNNGWAIANYINQNNLAPTTDNFYAAINALFASLDWVVKPAKLLAQEKETATTIIPVSPKPGDDGGFTAKVRQGEQKDADAKEHADLVKQCEAIINGYNPTKNNQYDGREQKEMQALWTKELNTAKQKSVEAMRVHTKSLIAARAKRYADREKASERL